jgi:hypothetical protein
MAINVKPGSQLNYLLITVYHEFGFNIFGTKWITVKHG